MDVNASSLMFKGLSQEQVTNLFVDHVIEVEFGLLPMEESVGFGRKLDNVPRAGRSVTPPK